MRRYITACDANSPSAPIIFMKKGARMYMKSPINIPKNTMRTQESENILSAVSFFPSPRKIEMGTEEPTPIRSAMAKFMITNGIARLTDAKAVAPRNLPT